MFADSKQDFNAFANKIRNTLASTDLLPKMAKSGKTMFKLPLEAFEFINAIASVEDVGSTRESLDILAKFAKTNLWGHNVEFDELPHNSIRRSVSISEDAKKIFADIAANQKVSRDCVLYTAIVQLLRLINKKRTPQMKLEWSRKIRKMADEMRTIYNKPEYEEARRELLADVDEDLARIAFLGGTGDLGDVFAYIESLNELELLVEFEKVKNAEIDKS